jgi:hypothetical protein
MGRSLSWLTLGFLSLLPSLSFGVGPQWPILDMPRFWVLPEGSPHLSFDGSYFYTRENYALDGTVERPLAMEHVRYGNARFHLGYGFTPRFSVFLQADVRGLFVSNALGSDISDTENYGFGDAMIAGRWLVYRNRSTDKVYPSEWSPESWLFLLEPSWTFPTYARSFGGKPSLGNQSNDISLVGRFAWYVNDWLGLGGWLGASYRTFGYEPAGLWGLRADFLIRRYQKWRIWTEFKAIESLTTNRIAFNPRQPDPIPGGSSLFKSDSPVSRTVHLGIGFRLGPEWELAAEAHSTATGNFSAKGYGGSLGLAWRPYQKPELSYDDYRLEQIKRLQQEPTRFLQKRVIRYGFQATVIRVSNQGNFISMAFGKADGVREGDTFHLFEPDNFAGRVRTPLALARVVRARSDDSFLRVEDRFEANLLVRPGYELRRVIIEE